MESIYISLSVRQKSNDSHLVEPFDFSVCMEFLEIKGKLGEGGFG
jgi:hypothetical protein